MAMTSIGDLAAGFALRRQMAAAKSDLASLTQTMTTGQTADIGRRLGGNLAQLAAIDATLSRLDGYAQVTDRAGQMASARQAVLEQVSDTAADLSPTLLRAGSVQGTGQTDTAARAAEQALGLAVSALNTRLGDQTVMAGFTPDQPALISADDLLTAAAAAVAGATGAQGVETALANWFDAPAGFQAVAYRGGVADAPVPVADGRHIDSAATAADPAVKGSLRAMVMAALATRGVPADAAEQTQLVQRAGEVLAETATARTDLAAKLGAAAAEIDDAATRNAAQASALSQARNDLTVADPYETATRLTDTQSRLELIYALTARLGKLSLAEYL